MLDPDILQAELGTPQVLLSLMLNQRQDCWSRRTTIDTTFRVFMFSLTIVPFFLPVSARSTQPQIFLFVFASVGIGLLWNSQRTSLDRSIRLIEIRLFRLVEATGKIKSDYARSKDISYRQQIEYRQEIEDEFIRSKDMSYPGLVNRTKLLTTLEPAFWVSVILNVFLLRYAKGI